MKKLWKTTAVFVLVLLLSSCASHRTRIHCEGHLKPLNAPAPVTPGGGQS